MLIVETPAVRFDMSYSQTQGQEYLLERISWLELRMVQLVGKLEHVLNLMLQQSNNIFFDHTLLDALITVLAKEDLIQLKELNDIWNSNRKRKNERKEGIANIETLCKEWISDYKGKEKNKFKELIQEACQVFSTGNFKNGIKLLERAAAFQTDNVSLNLFLGISFFKERKTTIARDYFLRVYKPGNQCTHLGLLLAMSFCEEGELEEAKDILVRIVRKKESLFSAHYVFGRLLVANEKWQEAITQFKKGLAKRPSPEAHYVLANAYYSIEKLELAETHLQRAVEMDSSYAEVFYLYGLILVKKKNIEKAKKCFFQAVALDTDNKIYSAAVRNLKTIMNKKITPPLFSSLFLTKKKLVTSGDERITQIVWNEVINEFSEMNDKSF